MEEGITPKPCPYHIPAIPRPHTATLKKLDPWHIQEFFRVELLIRSNIVMNLFESEGFTKVNYCELFVRHGFGWEVLLGAPFHFLDPQPNRINAIPGLLYLTFEMLAEFLRILNDSSDNSSTSDMQQMRSRFRERFMCLLVDPALPPDKVLKALRPVLQHRHKPNESTKTKWRLRKFHVPTWLDYLACYDLRVTEGLPYGQIAQRVYGKKGPKAREQAETAVKRVRHYIEAAERHEWPPKQQ